MFVEPSCSRELTVEKKITFSQLTFGDFFRSGSVGGVQVDLLDEFNVGEERDEGHEKGVGDHGVVAAVGGAQRRANQILLHLIKTERENERMNERMKE